MNARKIASNLHRADVYTLKTLNNILDRRVCVSSDDAVSRHQCSVKFV